MRKATIINTIKISLTVHPCTWVCMYSYCIIHFKLSLLTLNHFSLKFHLHCTHTTNLTRPAVRPKCFPVLYTHTDTNTEYKNRESHIKMLWEPASSASKSSALNWSLAVNHWHVKRLKQSLTANRSLWIRHSLVLNLQKHMWSVWSMELICY